MIAGKRKTIGVFLCKAYAVFDNAVYRVLEELSRQLDYDVVVFSTVGYFASQNEYDAQERRMFSFAPIEKLDGILMAPDTYEIEGFREALLDEIRSRANCPVVAVRHFSDEFDCTYTDEENTIRPLTICHGFHSWPATTDIRTVNSAWPLFAGKWPIMGLKSMTSGISFTETCGIPAVKTLTLISL